MCGHIRCAYTIMANDSHKAAEPEMKGDGFSRGGELGGPLLQLALLKRTTGAGS